MLTFVFCQFLTVFFFKNILMPGEGDEYEDEEEEDDSNGSDKYQGESAEEGDDDESAEEGPKNRYRSGGGSGESGEEDPFDSAWKKYGYGPQTAGSEEEYDDDNVESSESRVVPERKKIVHMKMEYFSSPHKGSEEEQLVEAASNVEKSVHNPKTDTEAIDVGDNKRKKKRRKSKSGEKSHDQHPNAGPDDLKYFQ
jgi:hypothetical protein